MWPAEGLSASTMSAPRSVGTERELVRRDLRLGQLAEIAGTFGGDSFCLSPERLLVH